MLYAGIDEAGYGPMFGPLCAGVSVFEIPTAPEQPPPCLWEALGRMVTRTRRDARGRVVIDDSKKLKGAGKKRHPLTHLERGVLLFTALAHGDAAWLEGLDDAAFLSVLGTPAPEGVWYDSTTPLPLGQDASMLRIDRARLDRCCQEAGIRCAHLAAVAVPAAEFNHRVETAGSKAIVNFELMVELAESCWKRSAGRTLVLAVDRHGGRIRYLDDLRTAWPEADRQVLEETDTASRYLLSMAGRGTMEISFTAGADARHLPVALASMTAKYVRELMMIRLNRFFAAHMPELKPTAGYVEDGRRFLSDIEPVIDRAGLVRAELVRCC
jgi:ribonuclease HII